MSQRPPITDSIIVALSRLVDDSQTEKREPSHSDIEYHIDRARLSGADPARQGRPVGKSKRVRAVLYWAMANDVAAGEQFVTYLVSTVRGYGGFRQESVNYCGDEGVANLVAAFSAEGWDLLPDGLLQPKLLDSLDGAELTLALTAYIERARRGALDSPLLAGTAKDLLEATAGHVIQQSWGQHPKLTDFPTLLGQAYTALDFATPSTPVIPGEPAHKRVERESYNLACALNSLRNKEGTGHGRPWLSSITPVQAQFAIESMGNIAALMLNALRSKR